MSNGGGDMHRATGHTGDEIRHANQPDELKQRSVFRELDAVARRVDLAIRLTNDHDAGGSKHTAELLDYGLGERFALAAGQGMTQDKWRMYIETGQRVAARKRIA